MSDAKQPEPMRPIPDGGLKDAMPSWLKRPPAWRDLPSADQRHQRSLPEPDTSEIDPHSLVDVTDLPQWLQAIAARGEIAVPTPDASVEHAMEVVHAAQHPVAAEPEPAEEATPEIAPQVTTSVTTTQAASESAETIAPAPVTAKSAYPVWIWPMAALVILVLVLTLYILN